MTAQQRILDLATQVVETSNLIVATVKEIAVEGGVAPVSAGDADDSTDLSKLRGLLRMDGFTDQQVLDRAHRALKASERLNDATVRLVDGSARSDTEARAALKGFFETWTGIDEIPTEADRQAASQREGRL